jgi:hypothetical protein
MLMTWEAVGAILGMIAGAQAAMLFVVRAVVRSEIAKLNGTYTRKELCQAIHGENARRIERLETSTAAALGRGIIARRIEDARLDALEDEA